MALWAGLSIYSSAFIAEIVRAAIQSVPGASARRRGARAEARPDLALVVLPQALRVMVPPLTSQYLNLIKSTSLGAAIAYPEIFSIFAGTVLNQTGQEIEIITHPDGVFLSINLAPRRFMNWYNAASLWWSR